MGIIYKVETETFEVNYTYDYVRVVNSYVNIGIDCKVYYTEIPEDIDFMDMTEEDRDMLPWHYENEFHA